MAVVPKACSLLSRAFGRSDSDEADGEGGPVDSAATGRALQGSQFVAVLQLFSAIPPKGVTVQLQAILQLQGCDGLRRC